MAERRSKAANLTLTSGYKCMTVDIRPMRPESGVTVTKRPSDGLGLGRASAANKIFTDTRVAKSGHVSETNRVAIT